MKILFFGAGVLGSLYAARLHEAGNDVALVARGKRYEDLQKHGVILEDFVTKKRTTTKVRVLDHMPQDEYFDICVVLVQKTQLNAALPTLATNPLIPTFLIMTNTMEKPQLITDTLGKERVVFGHVNAGGERDGHVVKYMISQEMTMGELDGQITERLKKISDTFKHAGFPVVHSKNMIAWKRYHIALVSPLAYAILIEGACNRKLSKNRKSVRKMIQGIREGMEVLQANGDPVEPAKLKSLFWIPNFLLIPLFQWLLKLKIMDIGAACHARNAKDEMDQLSQELFAIAKKAGKKTPVLEELSHKAELSMPSSAAS